MDWGDVIPCVPVMGRRDHQIEDTECRWRSRGFDQPLVGVIALDAEPAPGTGMASVLSAPFRPIIPF